MVASSLRAIGLPDEKILETSYGWDPERFAGTTIALPPFDGPTLIFCGFLCIRKGAATLLRAWEMAGIKGRLVLVGAVEPIVREKFGHILAREDVISVPFTHDVGGYFRSADWFIFPSMEEGGPQVTYEAAGCGLPSLVTPMGAGAIVRDGVEGNVLDSNDPTAWAELIRHLPERKIEREEMAANAQERAAGFSYRLVGEKRARILHDWLASNPAI